MIGSGVAGGAAVVASHFGILQHSTIDSLFRVLLVALVSSRFLSKPPFGVSAEDMQWPLE